MTPFSDPPSYSDDPTGDEQTPAYREALDALRRALRGPVTLRSTLTVVAELARANVPSADGAAVSVTTADPPAFAGSGAFVSAIDALQHGIGEGPTLTAIRQQRPTAMEPTAPSESPWPRFAYEAAELGIGSLLAYPLQNEDEVIGSLTLYAYAPSAFDDQARSEAAVFASAAGVAVQYARAAHSLNLLATELSGAIDTQATVDVAVGVLMQRDRVDADAAYRVLRRLARAQRLAVDQAARGVIVDAIRRGQAQSRNESRRQSDPDERR